MRLSYLLAEIHILTVGVIIALQNSKKSLFFQ